MFGREFVSTSSGLVRRDLFPDRRSIRAAEKAINLPNNFEISDFSPPFAQGKCLIIGGGDYKTVYVDNDGKSDSVIKRYDKHIYRGANALEIATAAANELRTIYEVLREICGDYYLPSEIHVAPLSRRESDTYAVFEVQKRGIFVDLDEVFDDQTVTQLKTEGENVATKFHTRAVPELKSRGIIPAKLNDLSVEHRDFHPKKWDLLSAKLVVEDVVDWLWWRNTNE